MFAILSVSTCLIPATEQSSLTPKIISPPSPFEHAQAVLTQQSLPSTVSLNSTVGDLLPSCGLAKTKLSGPCLVPRLSTHFLSKGNEVPKSLSLLIPVFCEGTGSIQIYSKMCTSPPSVVYAGNSLRRLVIELWISNCNKVTQAALERNDFNHPQ